MQTREIAGVCRASPSERGQWGLIGHPMGTKMNWKKSKGRSLASAGASTISAACCCGLSTGNYLAPGVPTSDRPQ